MAANTDNFLQVAPNWVGSLGSAISNSTTTTIGLVSSTGLPTATAVELVIDRVDSNGNQSPQNMEVIKGVVSGSNVISCIRGVEGTAQAHSAGAVVEVMLCSDEWNSLMNGLLTEHNQDGTHASNIARTSQLITLSQVYPVGSIYISTVPTNPATLFGFGSWSAYASGRTLIGVGTSDETFSAGATGGESNHLLTGSESGEAGHNHSQNAHSHLIQGHSDTRSSGSSGTEVLESYTGTDDEFTSQSVTATNNAVGASNASSAHNNLPPYIVAYIWTRTA
jgi:hypothetical protein